MSVRRGRPCPAALIALLLIALTSAPATAAYCHPGADCASAPLSCGARVGLLLTWHAVAEPGSWWFRVTDERPAPLPAPATTAGTLHRATLADGRSVLLDLRDAVVRHQLRGVFLRDVTVTEQHGRLTWDAARRRVVLDAHATLVERHRRWLWFGRSGVTSTPVRCTANFELPDRGR